MRAKWKVPGLLVASLAGALALIGSAGAGSAFASCASTTKVAGQGSSLQNAAQQLWIKESKCPVEYVSSSSGTGRKSWGIEAKGHKPKDGTKENPAEAATEGGTKYTFVASDEPLDAEQLTNLDEAGGGTKQALVIPVTQAAVAVIVKPPAECTITKITNAALQEVWNGKYTKWSQISSASGSGCSASIVRVAREDVSGTTFVFKTYLNEINAGAVCGKTWKEWATPTNNLSWPENGVGSCTGLSTLVHAEKSGGGGEAEEVKATSGSIGYANLNNAKADYEAGKLTWLEVQNQANEGTAEYQWPGEGTEPSATATESNCAKTTYGPKKPSKAEANDNWSEVNGAHPGNGTETNTHYPICTLTYDIAVVSPSLAEFPSATAEGTTTKEYLEYVVSETEGQSVNKDNDYRKVEEAVGKFAVEEAKLLEV